MSAFKWNCEITFTPRPL